MNIKSNSKKQKTQHTKNMWKWIKNLVPEMGVGMKIMVMVVAITLSAMVWSFSGMASLFLIVFGFILIVQDQWGNIGIGSRVLFTFFALIGTFILGIPNIYHTPDNVMEVKYSKLTFTDSTEKIIIFMTHPVKRTINQPLSTTEYYTLKEHRNDLNMTITESAEYDHWSMLNGRENGEEAMQLEEYTYAFTIKSPSGVIENPYWLKTKSRYFITKEKK